MTFGPYIIYYIWKKFPIWDKFLTMAKLVRSNRKIIAGVCAGIADYLGWDPVWVRILFVLLSIATVVLTGILVYIVLWIAMPEST